MAISDLGNDARNEVTGVTSSNVHDPAPLPSQHLGQKGPCDWLKSPVTHPVCYPKGSSCNRLSIDKKNCLLVSMHFSIGLGTLGLPAEALQEMKREGQDSYFHLGGSPTPSPQLLEPLLWTWPSEEIGGEKSQNAFPPHVN